MTVIRRFIKNDKGATAIEYGLLVGLLAIGLIGAMGALGIQLDTTLRTIVTELVNAFIP